jgi:hypothetical protein
VYIAAAAVPDKAVAAGALAVGALVVFVTVPAVLLVTVICTWHEVFAANVAAVKRTSPSPAALAPPDILVTVPHDIGVKVKVVFDKVVPTGKVSSTRTVLKIPGFALGLVNVRVKVPVPPYAIGLVTALVNVGGVYTFNVSLAAAVVVPCAVVIVLVVFNFAPAVVPVTFTVTVQLPPAGIV